MPENNCYLIDWFSASCFVDDYSDIFPILGFYSDICYSFQDGYGHHGYSRCVYLGGIYIYYDYRDDPRRCWVEMSGQGCRTFETYSDGVTFLDLFRRCVGDDPFFILNRVDLAYDIYNDPFLFDRMKSAIDGGCCISRFGTTELQETKTLQGGSCSPDFSGRTLYFGSPSSDIRFRLYDKKLERKRDDLPSWYRFEMVFRRGKALELALNISSRSELGGIFCGYLKEYLSVRDRSSTDSNYRRWLPAPWWERFTSSAENITELSKKEVSYNVMNAQYLVREMYGNTIDVILQTMGADELVELVRNREQRMNFAQINAVRLYKLNNKDSDSNG